MRDLPFDHRTGPARPLGVFVHHQGCGHRERIAALLRAMPPHRPVRVFCATAEGFGPLPPQVEIDVIPSLFEATGRERAAEGLAGAPETLHCAPIGWPGIREAMGRMAQWFAQADPALMLVDVSAEVAQLARLCSVPHVKVLQHGDRADAGHRAAYDGAVGLLAPYHVALAQRDWTPAMRAKTHFAGGLGLSRPMPARAAARARLGWAEGAPKVVAITGGGGHGLSQAPLALGARAWPEAEWLTLGRIERDWHATEPPNIRHLGWSDRVGDHIAGADLVISTAGNTTCAQVLAAGVPWIVVPEWCYFDEQVRKAEALSNAGLAHVLQRLPASVQAWTDALQTAQQSYHPEAMRALTSPHAARDAAAWLEGLMARVWPDDPVPVPQPDADRAKEDAPT
ncbi:MAG: glycosyltransferase [Shimia sp.]